MLPFSKNLYNQRETARFQIMTINQESRKALRPAYFRFLAALKAGEDVFLDATEAEREVFEAAKKVADEKFFATVTLAEAEHEALLLKLPENDLASRNRATETFHKILRGANDAYDRKVGTPTLILRAVEKNAMVVYERVAQLAYDEYQRELASIETSEKRSSCDAGRPRFVFQEAS